MTSDEQPAEREQPEFASSAAVNQVLAELTSTAPMIGADERAAAADRRPDHHLDRVGRRELAGIDDADLRHVERAGDAGHHGRDA